MIWGTSLYKPNNFVKRKFLLKYRKLPKLPHVSADFDFNKLNSKKQKTEGGGKDGGGIGREDHFLPHKFLKRTFQPEQTPQNNFCRLAEDIRQPEKQTIVFKNR